MSRPPTQKYYLTLLVTGALGSEALALYDKMYVSFNKGLARHSATCWSPIMNDFNIEKEFGWQDLSERYKGNFIHWSWQKLLHVL